MAPSEESKPLPLILTLLPTNNKEEPKSFNSLFDFKVLLVFTKPLQSNPPLTGMKLLYFERTLSTFNSSK